jgi:hypothetical protein
MPLQDLPSLECTGSAGSIHHMLIAYSATHHHVNIIVNSLPMFLSKTSACLHLFAPLNETYVYEHPYCEYDLFAYLLDNEQREHDLSGDIEREREQRHGKDAVVDWLPCHEDVTDGVANADNTEEHVVHAVNGGIDLRREDVVARHSSY